MTSKEEFLIYLADRLKITDMYGVTKIWLAMSKSEDSIEKLIESDELTITEKVYIGISFGLDMCKYLKNIDI